MTGTVEKRGTILAAALAVALASCQAIEKENAQDTEQLLAAAGFQMKLADTPERLAHLKTLAQRKIVVHDQDGQPRYVYADADGCKCLYAGAEKNYDEFQKLATKEAIAEENEAAAMNWGMWGPWPGW